MIKKLILIVALGMITSNTVSAEFVFSLVAGQATIGDRVDPSSPPSSPPYVIYSKSLTKHNSQPRPAKPGDCPDSRAISNAHYNCMPVSRS